MEVEIPEQVKSFLKNLGTAIRSGNVAEIRTLYDSTYNQLTEQHYRNHTNANANDGPVVIRHWPNAEASAAYLGESEIVSVLYKELYYRYMYQQRNDMPQAIRLESWTNYIRFFEIVNSGNARFDLPHSWLWDILDEFIYQTQSNNYWRSYTNTDNVLRRNPNTWNPIEVIRMLEVNVEVSNIRGNIAQVQKGAVSASSITDYGPNHVRNMIGYNSMVALLRIHTQIGDYFTAMRCVEDSDLIRCKDERLAVYNSVPACFITLHYYAGFCCLMLRRYQDSFRFLTAALRCKNYYIMSYQQQIITTILRHATETLGLLLSVYPQRLDDTVRGVKEIAEDIIVNGADEETIKVHFIRACPKYMHLVYAEDVPAGSEYKTGMDNKAQYVLTQDWHCRTLAREIQQQGQIPVLRTYLRLYDEITIERLAALQSTHVETSVVTCQMLCWKHKCKQMTYPTDLTTEATRPNGGLLGVPGNANAGVDYSIQGSKVTVTVENRSSAGQGGLASAMYFLRELGTLKEIEDELQQQ